MMYTLVYRCLRFPNMIQFNLYELNKENVKATK
jgi:hypothetical protein